MNIIFLGAPGSGKGTQAVKLTEAYNLSHLSTGNIISEAVKKQTPLGVLSEQYLKVGKLIPDKEVISLMKDEISTLKTDFILDGFPRTLNQAKALQEFICEPLNKKIDYVFYLEADLNALIERASNRLVCPKCKRSYNKLISEDITNCEHDNETLIQRDDDKDIKIIKARIQTYLTETLPLVEYFQDEKILHVIDANQASKLVFENIKRVINYE